MTETSNVLGQLAAIHTLIENFPMSILDMRSGKEYTSIFEFVVDVLQACGVPTNVVLNWLLEQIYGVESLADKLSDKTLDAINRINTENMAQSEFISGLEESIKVILMSLLSSMFTCSAIPVLPNKMFDGPNSDSFKNFKNKTLLAALQTNSFKPFIVPVNAIDPMGLLRISPTSEEGRLLYGVEGSDKYYHKEMTTHTITTPITKTFSTTTETTVYVNEYADVFENQKLYITYSKDSTSDKLEWDIYFNTTENLKQDLKITVNYIRAGHTTYTKWECIIKKDTNKTETPLRIYPRKDDNSTYISSITLNEQIGGAEITPDKRRTKGVSKTDKKTWIYLSKEDSFLFLTAWDDAHGGINDSIWGSENTIQDMVRVEKKLPSNTISSYTTYEYSYEQKMTYVEYKHKDLKQLNGGKKPTIERVSYVNAGDLSENDPSFIVCYQGLDPNCLYRSMDMNAFIWYALRKGSKMSQEEYNHMMWDSRVFSKKRGVNRENNKEWNEWYQSKQTYTDEFLWRNDKITRKKSPMFPVIQLEPMGTAENALIVHLPSQMYFMPQVREGEIFGTEIKKHGFNSTLYKFNWDYLRSIQILQPKLLLTGLCKYLLGYSVTTISSIDFNLTKKIIEAKIESAINNIVMADDMEIEDCYTSFSNDELNTMMEEMLLSRYDASYYGGEQNVIRTHDKMSYIDMLDKVNANAATEGTTTQIQRMVYDVTNVETPEQTIEFGIKPTFSDNVLKKLLWAFLMPIATSLFTPQVMMLLYINFELMGITKSNNFLNQDFGKIVNYLMNKILGLIKSIILFVKDKLVSLLIRLLLECLLPIMLNYKVILVLEHIRYWLDVLNSALACLPRFTFKLPKVIDGIQDVTYADITTTQETPESTSSC